MKLLTCLVLVGILLISCENAITTNDSYSIEVQKRPNEMEDSGEGTPGTSGSEKGGTGSEDYDDNKKDSEYSDDDPGKNDDTPEADKIGA